MNIAAGGTRERRWVVLAEDGRYATLGRHADPSPEDILRTEEAMRAQGIAGWLAVMEGNPHAGPMPRLMEVRPMLAPMTSFTDARAAVLAAIGDTRSRG